MTSWCLWKNFAIYAFVTSQVVLSGVLHSSEEIGKRHQQYITEDELDNNNNGIYKYKIEDQKYPEDDGETFKYGKRLNNEIETLSSNDKNIITETSNINLQKKETKDPITGSKLNYESETLHHDEKLVKNKVSDIVGTKINSNDDRIKDNKSDNKLTPRDEIIKGTTFYDIEPEERDDNDDSAAKEGNSIIELDHDVYDLHEEKELHKKKHNKRDLNYHYNYKNDDYYRRPNNNFENNFNRFIRHPHYNEEQYYKNNDYHNKNIDYPYKNLNRFKHSKFNEERYSFDNDNSDYDDSDDDDDDDDDNDKNESDNEDIDDEVEQGGDKFKEFNILNEDNSDQTSDLDSDDETLQVFTYLLESIITQKLKELEEIENTPYLEHKPHILKINHTKEGLFNKQKNDTGIPKNNTNSSTKLDFENELHSNPVKEEWRSTRNIRDSILSLLFKKDDDNTLDNENHQNIVDLEKQFRKKAVDKSPFIIIQSDEELNEDSHDNKNDKHDDYTTGLKYDDNPDSIKDEIEITNNEQRLDSFEDEETFPTKKVFRRSTEPILRPHYHDTEMNRQFGYPSYIMPDNTLRMNLNRFPRINYNEGPYVKELPVRRPPLHVLNNHNSDISSVFDMHEQFDNFNKFEDKSTYAPDTVMMYSFNNENQDVPNDNTNNQFTNQHEENNEVRHMKVKRDLRHQLENIEKKESNNYNDEFIESSLNTIENLIAKYLLENLKDLPEKLSEHEKEKITKNILHEVTNKISHQDMMACLFKQNDVLSHYYQQMDPTFGSDGSLVEHESKTKREIDNHNYYNERAKPCINIKNLNIFYEFGEEGKNCIHIPKYIESTPKLNSMKYHKRHSIPYQDNMNLLEKDKKIMGMTPKGNPNSLSSDTVVLPKKNTQDKINVPTRGYYVNKANDKSLQMASVAKAHDSNRKVDRNEMETPSSYVTLVSNLEKPHSDIKSVGEEIENVPLQKTGLQNNDVNLVNEIPKNEKLNTNNTKPINLPNKSNHETQNKQENTDKQTESISKNRNLTNMDQNSSSVNRSKVSSSKNSINPPLPTDDRQLEKTDTLNQVNDPSNKQMNVETDCAEGEVCYRNSLSESNEKKDIKNTSDNKEGSKDKCNKRRKENRNQLIEGESEKKRKKCQRRKGERKINEDAEEQESNNKKLITEGNDSYSDERQLVSPSQVRDENNYITAKSEINQNNPRSKVAIESSEDANLRKKNTESNKNKLITDGNNLDSDKRQLVSASQVRDENNVTAKSKINQSNQRSKVAIKSNEDPNLRKENTESNKKKLITEGNNLDSDNRQLVSASQVRDENNGTAKSKINQSNPRSKVAIKSSEDVNSRKESTDPNKQISNNEKQLKSKTSFKGENLEERKFKQSENKWIPDEVDTEEQGKHEIQEENEEEIPEEKLKIKKGGTKKVISNSKKDYYIKDTGIMNDKESAHKKPVKRMGEINFETNEHNQNVNKNVDNNYQYINEDSSENENENHGNDVSNINDQRKGMTNTDDDHADYDDGKTISNDDEYEEKNKVKFDEQYYDDEDYVDDTSDFEQINTEIQSDTDNEDYQDRIERETQIVKPMISEKNIRNDENEYDQNEDEDYESDEFDDQNIYHEYEDVEKDSQQLKNRGSSSVNEKLSLEDEDKDYSEEKDDYTDDEYVNDHIQAKRSSNQVSDLRQPENTKNLEINQNNDYITDDYDERDDNEEEEEQDSDGEMDEQGQQKEDIKITPKIFEKNYDKKTQEVLNNIQEERNDDTEDENGSDLDVTIIDTNNELKQFNSRSQVTDEKEDKNDGNNKPNEFSKELNNPQITQIRRTKSTLKEDETSNESFTDEEKIDPHKTDHRNLNTLNESDYVRKSDVEKLIQEILDSSTNSKHKEEMFYDGPQYKYKELVKDIATYFAKKNLTAGDDICIYEEYGSKHGDNDAIYLSGTKLYQNGVPKKDAENFNIIIKRPHHKIEDVSEKSTEMLMTDNIKNVEQDSTESYKPFIVKEYERHHNKHSKSKRHYEPYKTSVGNSKIQNKEPQKKRSSKILL